MDRRTFAGGAAASVLGGSVPASQPRRDDTAVALAALEAQSGGTLGAWFFDPVNGREAGWRGDARFAQCSTFKLSLAACVLHGIDRGVLKGSERLGYTAAELVTNSPVTGANVSEGAMSLLALVEAAQKTSDNLAANLVLRRIGGPPALTRFWRSLGDRVSRLDRTETALNRVVPGDLRDTVTPRTISRSVARFTVGPVLSGHSRALLQRWMEETTTGTRRIRAGLPAGWRAGDKTGTVAYDDLPAMVNDIALCWPPGAATPIVVAAFYRTSAPVEAVSAWDEAVLAQVGSIAARWWSGH